MPDRTVPIRVEVDPLLVPRPGRQRSGLERLHAKVGHELRRLMRILGVPGTLDLDVKLAGDGLRMWVHDTECRYPPELLSRVWSTLADGWLARASRQSLGDLAADPTARRARFVAVVCREIVASRPSVLLARPHAARYVERTPAARLDPEWVLGTLARVLDARITIGNRDVICSLLAEQQGKLCRNAAEVLIERLRPDVLTVLLHREYLRELTLAESTGAASLVDDVRSRVQDDLGIAPPRVVFAEDEKLPPRGVAFVVNDLETLTWIGLPADSCMVGDAVETLTALGIPDGRPALHPVTEVECTVIPRRLRNAAAEYYIPTWGPDEYLGLCLEATMREYASCLIDSGTVRSRLTALDAIDSACVVLGRRLPKGRIVRLMRSLLAEQVSVSDFPALIELLAEQDVELKSKIEDEIWSDDADAEHERRDRAANAAARRRLSRQVAAKVVSDGIGQSVGAVCLDARFNQAFAAATDHPEPLAPDDHELLSSSVAAYLAGWEGDRWPALLTSAKLRSAVHEALAPQFPGLLVVAYEELPLDVDLRLLDRIVPKQAPVPVG